MATLESHRNFIQNYFNEDDDSNYVSNPHGLNEKERNTVKKEATNAATNAANIYMAVMRYGSNGREKTC